MTSVMWLAVRESWATQPMSLHTPAYSARSTTEDCSTVFGALCKLHLYWLCGRRFSPQTLHTTKPCTGLKTWVRASLKDLVMQKHYTKYLDNIAFAFDEKNWKLTCINKNYSLYIIIGRTLKRLEIFTCSCTIINS